MEKGPTTKAALLEQRQRLEAEIKKAEAEIARIQQQAIIGTGFNSLAEVAQAAKNPKNLSSAQQKALKEIMKKIEKGTPAHKQNIEKYEGEIIKIDKQLETIAIREDDMALLKFVDSLVSGIATIKQNPAQQNAKWQMLQDILSERKDINPDIKSQIEDKLKQASRLCDSFIDPIAQQVLKEELAQYQAILKPNAMEVQLRELKKKELEDVTKMEQPYMDVKARISQVEKIVTQLPEQKVKAKQPPPKWEVKAPPSGLQKKLIGQHEEAKKAVKTTPGFVKAQPKRDQSQQVNSLQARVSPVQLSHSSESSTADTSKQRQLKRQKAMESLQSEPTTPNTDVRSRTDSTLKKK
ncbi:MAG: hypothetical protein JSR17_10040 [Proteobacteria bacterium]|nr:hypothetical protein [Pseudomonadota bacterium]